MKVIALLLVVALVSVEASSLRSRLSATEEHKSPWTYVSGGDPATCGDGTPCGPEAWYNAKDKDGNKFAKCELSVVGEQSPINLVSYPPTAIDLASADADKKAELSWKQIGNWKSDKPKLVNNGHTLQVNMNLGDDGNTEYNGDKYILRQFHFHAPSEHTVGTVHRDGHYMMEMHMVHTTADGKKVLVIGSFLEKAGDGSSDNEKWFQGFFDSFPAEGQPEVEFDKPIDAGQILDWLAGDYYSYKGSFTTPPCTEGVRWIIFKKTLQVSEAIRTKFLEKMPDDIKSSVGNARPTQPLNLRTVYLVKPAPAANGDANGNDNGNANGNNNGGNGGGNGGDDNPEGM